MFVLYFVPRIPNRKEVEVLSKRPPLTSTLVVSTTRGTESVSPQSAAMSGDSSKSWVAIGRRHEQDVSIVDAYTEVFESLAWSQGGKCPMPIADTVIFRRLSTTYYSYDWPQQRVMALPQVSTPTQAVKQFMSMDEGNSISAVFLSEVKDSNGYLISAEYLTIHALSNFFHSGDTKKVGVLQRYVYPRPFRHVDEVAQEVLVTYHATGGAHGGSSVAVERRLGTHPLDGVTEHATVRGNLFHPVATSGKVFSRTLPFNAAECRYGLQAEHIIDSAFVSMCTAASQYIVSAMQSFRRLVYEETIASNNPTGRNSPDRLSRPPVRPVSRMVAQFRQSFHDSQIYFLGLIALRHPADKYHVDVRYEFVKIPTDGVQYVVSMPSQGELTITPLTQLQSALHSVNTKRADGTEGGASPAAAAAPPSPSAAAAMLDDDMDDDDDPNRFSPHRRPANPDLFACPNCNEVHHRDEFVRMEYREIVEHYLSQCRTSHKNTMGRLQHAKKDDGLNMYKSTSAASAAGAKARPTSASMPSSIERTSTRPQTAKGRMPLPAASASASGVAPTALVVTAANGSSVVVPPVLARLNIPVAELVLKPVRLLRSVPLCAECATSFGATIVTSNNSAGGFNNAATAGAADPFTVDGHQQEDHHDISRQQQQTSPHRSVSPHDRFTEATKQRLAAAPPSCLRSDVIDQMVVTPLQLHHKYLRQGERIRYEAKINESERQVAERQSARVEELVNAEELQLAAILDNFGLKDVIVVPAVASSSVSHGGMDTSAMNTSHATPEFAPPPPLEVSTRRQLRKGGGAAAPSATTEVEVLGTGPDVPLQTLLQNDLFYKLQAAIDHSDPRDGVSMAHDSSALPPIPRPSMVVLAEDIDSPAVQHVKRVATSARQGRRAAWSILEKTSTTFCDLTEEERLLIVNMVGGDPTNLLLIGDDGGLS